MTLFFLFFFFFQAEDGIRDLYVTGVQTCALPISPRPRRARPAARRPACAARCGPGRPRRPARCDPRRPPPHPGSPTSAAPPPSVRPTGRIMPHNGHMPRRVTAGLAGVACAGIGAWAGQRLGGNAGTAGIGAAVGAVSGAFAPGVTGWLATRSQTRDSAARTAELPRAVERPSRLLDPRRKVVDFAGREDELAWLTAWCEDRAGPTLRLITGAGGTGKTRLALRFADCARELGWHPHWVGDGQEADALARIRAVTSGRVL